VRGTAWVLMEPRISAREVLWMPEAIGCTLLVLDREGTPCASWRLKPTPTGWDVTDSGDVIGSFASQDAAVDWCLRRAECREVTP
jgi:hypothetical protein